MPTKKRRALLKQADQAPSPSPQVAYSDEEEAEGGFTLTGAEAMSDSPQAPASTSGLPPMELACTLQGVTSGLSGGALGYVFGFGTDTMHRNMRFHRSCTYATPGATQVVN